jgi:sigma-E factor negative regulatory protein RseC
VHTQASQGCSECQAKGACQQGRSATTLEVRVRRPQQQMLPLQPGDPVILAIDEAALLKTSLILYGFPLIGLFIALLAIHSTSASLVIAFFSALLGLALGGLAAHFLLERLRGSALLEPTLLPCYPEPSEA